ncbi:MAG: hypothetical protein M3X11_07875 [Acidobacteriota bacterium]|nr:hypothetical protein [Acidobacteriota bacterium]
MKESITYAERTFIRPPPALLLSRLTIALFASLLCAVLALAAAQQNSVAGHWEGAIKLPNGDLKISVDLTAANAGLTHYS